MSWINKLGYVMMQVGASEVYEHRVVWEQAHGPIPAGMHIDHINGVKSDNRLENLRLATPTQNCQNRRVAQSNNASTGLLGAYLNKKTGRYYSRIHVDGKSRSLGYFGTAEEAHAAYVTAKRELHPFCTI